MKGSVKKLVVYYSFDGNTRYIAETIAQTVGAEILELKPRDEIKTHGFLKFFWGARKVFMKEKPQLLPFEKNPQDYDLLFIGTPVWAFTYTPALETFFSTSKLKDKKIALFCCSGGMRGRTLEKMKEKLRENYIIGEIDFVEPFKRDKERNAEKAKRWARLVDI